MPERSGGDKARVVAVLVLLIAILVAALVILDLREYSLDDRVERYVVIVGWVAALGAALGLFLMLISAWAYGGARYLRKTRPAAVVLRSGSMPVLKAVLEEDRLLRGKLSRVRPPGILFLLVVDASGLEIWHGSGKGAPTGALERAAILSVLPGKTSEGMWTYNSLEFAVQSGEAVVRVPFVVRGAGAVFGAGKRETRDAHIAVARALGEQRNS